MTHPICGLLGIAWQASLFTVRGVCAYPAAQRAPEIAAGFVPWPRTLYAQTGRRAPRGFLPIVSRQLRIWLPGRDLKPRPLGYEPAETTGSANVSGLCQPPLPAIPGSQAADMEPTRTKPVVVISQLRRFYALPRGMPLAISRAELHRQTRYRRLASSDSWAGRSSPD